MGTPKQLTLFDLEAYSSEPSCSEPCQISPIDKKSSVEIEYEQLELDLFPQKLKPLPSESWKRAA